MNLKNISDGRIDIIILKFTKIKRKVIEIEKCSTKFANKKLKFNICLNSILHKKYTVYRILQQKYTVYSILH